LAGRNAGAVSGKAYSGRTGTPVAPAVAPVNGAGANAVAALAATNKREFEGKPLQASAVPVVKTVTNDVFWVGSNNAAPLLVVAKMSGNASPAAKLKAGETVNVRGTVEKAPPANEAAKNWGLDNAGTQRLEHEGAYLNADAATANQP
jgi:hypothetical protein